MRDFLPTLRGCVAVAVLVASLQSATAQPAGPALDWRPYADAETGTHVDFPSGLFPVEVGLPEHGTGRVFQTNDGRAQFSVYALERDANETPRSYLQKNLKVDPSRIDYRRVTDRFFAVSGVRDGKVYYSRCNFHRQMHCIYIAYPDREMRSWDGIVTRISLSLRGPQP
ncbi:MAG: hypothetical protein ABWY35_08860 [Pseudorhodoplanes sp.]